MDFSIKKRELPRPNYSGEDIKLAYEFTKLMNNEFGEFVKSIVLFGSTAKKTDTEKSDIDMMIIIDDVSIYLTRDVAHTFKLMTQKIVNHVSRRFHINTMRLTSFWEFVKNGDPIVINILRDGHTLLDSNLFDPLQLLLKQGRIRPTAESIWNYYSRSPITLLNSKWHILQATIDLYWAVIDSAHAALMKADCIPPSPDHVADLLELKYVKTKKLDKKYILTMRKFYRLMKMITHREIQDIPGKEFDQYYKEASEFLDKMKKIIEAQ